MESLRQDLMRKNARLYVVWVVTDPRDLQEENDPQKQRSGYVEAGALG